MLSHWGASDKDIHGIFDRPVAFFCIFYLGELELIKGELRQYHAEKMNQNTYLFSVIAAIFLPTSFLTGLLGVNVGGIPGTESPVAFALFCIALVGIFGLEFWILHRLRFFNKES